MSKQIAFYSPQGPVADQLLSAMRETGVSVSSEIDFTEQEILLIAFPDPMEDPSEINKAVMQDVFSLIQKFIQARLRKKSGEVVFLLSAGATGMSYEGCGSDNELFTVAQGGLVGFCKTIVKEYGKKNLNSNTYYIDWNNVSLQEVAELVVAKASKSLPSLQGQVIAVDKGVCI